MDRPDTLFELHRSVVEQMFLDRFPPTAVPPKPFQASVAEGEAHLNIAVSRVWFHYDASGRRWRQREGMATSDLQRHLAFDLQLDDHDPETGLLDSKLVFTRVLGLPIPPGLPTSCSGRQIPVNEVPLFGRLVIHDSLDRVESTLNGKLHHNIVLEFAEQNAPLLEASAAAPGFDGQMFGPGVQREPGNRVVLTGPEPRIVWELTPAEQTCIRQTTVGRLLVAQGIDPIQTIAEQLAAGVAEKLATAGDEGTSTASVLPEPQPVDPTGASDDPFQIDGVVRLFTRQGAGQLEQESLQIQIQTVDTLPDPLPASVLASGIDETVGFMRAGFAILRSIRKSQISSLCLAPSDFDSAAGCLLKKPVGIEIDGEGATLSQFSAVIEPSVELGGQDLLKIHGYAEGESWHSGWFIEFGLDFRLDRGDVARDPLPGELPPELQPSRTLKEMHARLRELAIEKCAGGDRAAIEDEQKQIAEEKNALPTEIGVKPEIFGEPFKRSDGWITTLGALAGIALVVGLAIGGLAIVAAASVSVAFTTAAVTAAFLIGYGVAIIGLAVLDDLYIDCKVSDGLTRFVNDKSQQSGDALPLEGYSPTSVTLQNGILRVFLAPLPAKLAVRYFEPDRPRPTGDPDYVSQQIAGLLPDGQRLWRLSVADAAHLIEKGRISMTLDPSATPGGLAIPVHVARSSRGRRYLRTVGDEALANNLASLPRIPAS